MPTVARVSNELRTSAGANLVVGDACLLLAAIRVDHPGTTILLFAAVSVVVAVAWARLHDLAARAARAGALPAGVDVEAVAATRRRVIMGLLPAAVVLAVLVAVWPQGAALIAALPAGVGAGDLWTIGGIRRLEQDRHDEVLRESPPSVFSLRRRRVYTRPMNDTTDAT